MKKIIVLSFLTYFIGVSLVVLNAKETDTQIEVMIGQMILTGFRGFELDDNAPVIEAIRSGKAGGVILFDYDVVLKTNKRNISSPKQLKALTKKLKKSAAIPLFIAIDQEGGRISRLKPIYGFRESISHANLGKADNERITRKEAIGSALQLKKMGLNINFAPVVDLNINPNNPVIGKLERSFSDQPEIVIRHSTYILDEFKKHGIIGALKHFPGHGSSLDDSHLGLTDVTESWQEIELEPYIRLIDSGYAKIIMTAHIFNRNLDPNYPATLSRKVLTDILRNKLRFEGVIITDDINMGAINDHYGFEEAIELTINAGADIVLVGNNLKYDDYAAQKTFDAILALYNQGKISKERIEESYKRIMEVKKSIK